MEWLSYLIGAGGVLVALLSLLSNRSRNKDTDMKTMGESLQQVASDSGYIKNRVDNISYKQESLDAKVSDLAIKMARTEERQEYLTKRLDDHISNHETKYSLKRTKEE